MRPLVERDRFGVGLAGLGALALVALLVLTLARLSPGSATYTAVLEHTGGLRVGEEVQVAGVGVGEVKEIRLGKNRVDVRFTLDKDIDLGGDTRAEVKVATLLGTHFLLVSPRGSGDLADQTIPLARTRVPFNLQDVIDQGVPEMGEFDTVTIERSLGHLATTLQASGGELGPALDGVRELSTVIADRSGQLGELLRAARRVTHQLSESGDDLIPLMRQADLILDTLRTRRATIHALLQDLAELGEQLSGVIEDTKADIGPTLRDLDKVIALLTRQEKNVGRTIRSLAVSARYFANAAGTGSWLDQYVPGATPDNLECVLKGACR